MAKTIQIGGKFYTLNFGMAALSNILRDFGVSLADLENMGSLDMMQAAQILHWGLYHQARIDKKPYDGNWQTACDILDQDAEPLNAMVDVITAFTESITEKSGVAESRETPEKNE